MADKEITRIPAWWSLKRLLKSPQPPKQAKTMVPDGIKELYSNAFVGELTKFYHDLMQLRIDRYEQYQEFDQMDADDLVVQILDMYAEDACVCGETSLSLVDGREVPVKDLVGKSFWVYAYDHEAKKIKPAKAKAMEATVRELVEVELDNGEKIRCTPDHPFMMRDGSFTDAGKLQSDDSLMPLYRKYNKYLKGYEMLYQPEEDAWHYTHRQFVERSVSEGCKIIHHKDFNKRNNCPDNLGWMSKSDHTALHLANRTPEVFKKISKTKKNWSPERRALFLQRCKDSRTTEVRQKISEASKNNKSMLGKHHSKDSKEAISKSVKEQWSDPEFKKKRSASISKGIKAANNHSRPQTEATKKKIAETSKQRWTDPEYKKRVTGKMKHSHKMSEEGRKKLSEAMKRRNAERGSKRKELVLNHKVVSVTKLDYKEMTYDVSVEKYHNFALTAGIFTHNTQPSSVTGKSIWIESCNKDIEEIGSRVLENINAESLVFSIARELSKYGDSFSGILQSVREDGTPGEVLDLVPAPVYSMSRIEDEQSRLKGFAVAPLEMLTTRESFAKLGQMQTEAPTDPPWSFIHWRLLGKERTKIYGTSFLQAARRPYKKLRLSEDNLVLYRLKRAPDRFVFALKGLEGMSPDQRRNTFDKFRQQLRKNQSIDPLTGQINQEVNPIAIDDDFIFDESAVSVDRLVGSTQINPVLDIDYLRKRLCGTTGIPPDYLGFSDTPGSFAADIPLSFQDVNFARKEKRLQRAIMEGFVQLVMLNLCWLGVDPSAKSSEFTIHMGPVSSTDERQMLEVDKIRADTIGVLIDIGNQLGIDTPEWHEYLLTRSGIPAHLLRKTPGEVSDIIKGQVRVNESRKPIKEGRLSEIDKKLEDWGLGHTNEESTGMLDRVIRIMERDNISDREYKILEDLFDKWNPQKNQKAVLNNFLNSSNKIFGSNIGSNKLKSTSVKMSPDMFPYQFSGEIKAKGDRKLTEGIQIQDTDKFSILESSNVDSWQLADNQDKVKETSDLMTETIVRIKKEADDEIKETEVRGKSVTEMIESSL